MRSIPTLLLSVMLVAACGAAEDQTQADQPAADAAATDEATAVGPTLADFAGTWETVATLEGVDEPVPSTMTGSAAGDDWTMSLEGRPGIPLRVSIVGDSLISESEEYESILRPGVMVSVRTAGVLHDDMIMGNLVSTYRTDSGEERVTGTFQSTRVQ